MNELEEFLKFVFENIEDDRVEVNKMVRFGFRNYTISMHIETSENPKGNLTLKGINSYNNVTITVDCRNKYIELNVNMDAVLIEDEELTTKWANILEEYLNSKIDTTVNRLIYTALGKSDLSREYKIKKIL